MGVQPKLEDTEVMDQDPPPLSEIKTGYTPTTTSSAGEIAQDFSHYENLDTPTPIKPTDLMAYTRFEPCKCLSPFPSHLLSCMYPMYASLYTLMHSYFIYLFESILPVRVH